MPTLGEIRIFAGNFNPAGWAFCDGQLLPIREYDSLFNLIGTTYGGDGQETFALPDLQGRIPIHLGNGFNLGEAGGTEEVTLTAQQIAGHSHALMGSAVNATTTSPTNNVPGTMPEVTTFAYGLDNPPTTLHPQSVGSAGGSQPHSNLQPFLVVNYIIALFGTFPSQT